LSIVTLVAGLNLYFMSHNNQLRSGFQGPQKLRQKYKHDCCVQHSTFSTDITLVRRTIHILTVPDVTKLDANVVGGVVGASHGCSQRMGNDKILWREL
jgi:hypothetical protein